MILVDSSVWIDFFRPAPGAAGRELRHLIAEAEPVALTGVVVTEVLQGLTRDIERLERLLGMWPLLEPRDFSTYRSAAAIFRLGRLRGISLTTGDTLIAAIAIEQGASVFTLDRDFARIAHITSLKMHEPAWKTEPCSNR